MQQEYKTSDLYLGAYLAAEGHHLVRTERAGARVVFCFDQDGLRPSLVAWAGGTAETNASDYAEAIKRFKALLYA